MSLTDREAAIAEQHIAYEGTVELAKWIDTSAHGFKITLNLEDRAQLDPFDGVMTMRKKRGGQRYQAIIAPTVTDIDHGTHPDWDRSTVQEWQFAGRGWSESAGAHIAMCVADPETIDYWRQQTTLDQSEEGAGGRYGIMLLELGDDEQIVNQHKRSRVIPPEELPGGPRSKAAARMIQEPEFGQWLNGFSIYGQHENPYQFDTIEARDALVKRVCGIETKKYFDNGPYADTRWQMFEDQFKRPYLKFLERLSRGR